METMLLVPVDDSVVFPTMTVTLAIDVGTEERVVLVPRKGEEFGSTPGELRGNPGGKRGQAKGGQRGTANSRKGPGQRARRAAECRTSGW